MSKQIWKFPLEAQTENKIEMPMDAEVLCVKYLGGAAVVYAICDTEAEKVAREFQVFPTGVELPDLSNFTFVDTFITGSRLVFHVFERL
jgi:hypothetical protein